MTVSSFLTKSARDTPPNTLPSALQHEPSYGTDPAVQTAVDDMAVGPRKRHSSPNPPLFSRQVIKLSLVEAFEGETDGKMVGLFLGRVSLDRGKL